MTKTRFCHIIGVVQNLANRRLYHPASAQDLIYCPIPIAIEGNIDEKSFQSIELEKYVTTNNCSTRRKEVTFTLFVLCELLL